ncbi:MAG: amino acid adenylation domain-containing protein [Eubacterium sp.]|nr:amino acid adenylation domain-containing protein [Eubacterium sp.]
MKITYEQSEEILIIRLSGELNTQTSPDAQREILERCSEISPSEVHMDLSELSLITSAGLRVLLAIKLEYKNLEVRGVTAVVFETFHMTGFDKALGVSAPEDFVFERGSDTKISVSSDGLKAAPHEHRPVDAVYTAPHFTGIHDTTEEYEYRSVVELFEEQVRLHPDRIAVITASEQITYAELDEKSNKIANSLRFLGVGYEDVIMILLPRGISTYIATLGILKAGAAYTIVNMDYPDDRIEFIHNDAGCKYLISDKKTVIDRLELVADVLQKRPLYMEEMLANPSADRPGVENAEQDLCYLIYTSGSTGKPKGVMIEHGNLSNFVYPTSKNYEANGITQKGTVLLAMAQMTFDVSVMEEYLGLTGGLTIALATEEEILNPSAMKDFMEKTGVDAVCFTPAYANTLVNIPEMRDVIRNIKTYDFGAEAFPGTLFTKIREINPDAYIMNGYGPTEATISCTMKVIESPDNITIGIPNANVYTFVINEQCEEVAKGEVGELLITGRGVGRGYRNLPEKTAESFITFRGMRAYRTGDLVRINEEDEIEFHGRIDNQVKLRGLRIELDEVEKVLASHPEVKLAAAKVFDNRILVGYYQLITPGSVTRDEMKAFVKKTLAHYMVPEAFVEVEDMPMTPNRKIDRKALEKPEVEEAEVVPPENERQEKLLSIVKEIFTDIQLGITTDIQDLGLSSLDTMLLASRIGKEFDVDVRFSDILKYPSVLRMEEMIDQLGRKRSDDLKEDYPVMNEIAFLSTELFEESCPMVFNLPYLYRMPVTVDVERLKRAVTLMLNNHPGLWARMEMRNGQIRILQTPDHGDYIPGVRDLTEEEFRGKNRLKRPFHPEERPFRFEIYRTEEAVYLFTDVHHTLIDGGSYEIMIAEIIAAYEGRVPEPETYSIFHFLDEAERFNEKGGSEAASRNYEDAFEKLRSIGNIAPFPKDREDGELKVTRLHREFAESAEEIREIAKGLKTSPTVLLLALSAVLKAGAAGNRTAVVNMVYDGRNDSRRVNTIGLLSTSFPVFVSWMEGTTVADYIMELQKQLVNSMGVLAQPFTKIAVAHPEIFDFGYSFLGEVTDEYRMDGMTFAGEALSPEGTGGLYGIYEEIYEKEGHFFFHTEYRANELNEKTIDGLFRNLETMLKTVSPSKTVDELLDGCATENR